MVYGLCRKDGAGAGVVGGWAITEQLPHSPGNLQTIFALLVAWVAPSADLAEGLLDGSGRRPAQQVQRAPGLVVGARLAAAPKGLLPHNGPGALVVEVKVPGRMLEDGAGLDDGLPVAPKATHRTSVGLARGPSIQGSREPVRGALVHQPQLPNVLESGAMGSEATVRSKSSSG